MQNLEVAKLKFDAAGGHGPITFDTFHPRRLPIEYTENTRRNYRRLFDLVSSL